MASSPASRYSGEPICGIIMQADGVQQFAQRRSSAARRPWRGCTGHLKSTAAFLTVCQIPQRRGIVTGNQASTTSAHWLALDCGAASALGTGDFPAWDTKGRVESQQYPRDVNFMQPPHTLTTQPVREPSPSRPESCSSVDSPASPPDYTRNRSPAGLPART